MAVILIGVAAIFLWRGNYEGVFVSAVLGSVCFFLSVRFEVGKRVKMRESEKLREREEEQESEI